MVQNHHPNDIFYWDNLLLYFILLYSIKNLVYQKFRIFNYVTSSSTLLTIAKPIGKCLAENSRLPLLLQFYSSKSKFDSKLNTIKSVMRILFFSVEWYFNWHQINSPNLWFINQIYLFSLVWKAFSYFSKFWLFKSK